MSLWRGDGRDHASRQVTGAVSEVLDLAPKHGEVTLARLVAAVGENRGRPIEISTADLPPGAGLDPPQVLPLRRFHHVMFGADSAMNGNVTEEAASRETAAS